MKTKVELSALCQVAIRALQEKIQRLKDEEKRTGEEFGRVLGQVRGMYGIGDNVRVAFEIDEHRVLMQVEEPGDTPERIQEASDGLQTAVETILTQEAASNGGA